MASLIKWSSSPAMVSAISAGLNSIAHNAGAVSAEIDNSTTLETFMDAELNLAAQGVARSAGAYCALYLIPTLDGTNDAYGAAALEPAAGRMLCAFEFDAATTARRDSKVTIQIPPGKFKLCLFNKTGQTLAASGNELRYRLYSLENK